MSSGRLDVVAECLRLLKRGLIKSLVEAKYYLQNRDVEIQ
jgi:hypothetical protein